MGWSTFTPSRTLNESGFSIAGLSIWDMLLLLCSFGLMQPLFVLFFKMSIAWPFGITVLQIIVFIIIRHKYRRHFLRDYIKFIFLRVTQGGAYYDPKTH